MFFAHSGHPQAIQLFRRNPLVSLGILSTGVLSKPIIKCFILCSRLKWKVKVLVTQSCLTLCDTWTVVSSVHGILQARMLKWVALSFSRGPSEPWDRTWVSCIAGRFFTIWLPVKPHLADLKAESFFDSIMDWSLPTHNLLINSLETKVAN